MSSVIDVRRIFRAMKYSIYGLKTVTTNQSSFRQELVLGALLIPIAIWLGHNGLEMALIISVLILFLIVELINSAIETTVDRIGSDDNALSKHAKDLGSSAV